MDTELLTKLLSRLAGTERVLPRFRTGVVTAATPLTITIGGSTSTVASAITLGSYVPTVGDVVICVTYANDLIILGKRSTGIPSQVGAFSAYRSAALSLASGNGVPFDTVNYDINSWYNTTNGRYTPQFPGKYRLDWCAGSIVLAAGQDVQAIVHKNGTLYRRGAPNVTGAGGSGAFSTSSAQVDANGTTDFFQVFFYHSAVGSQALFPGASNCYFQGELIAP